MVNNIRKVTIMSHCIMCHIIINFPVWPHLLLTKIRPGRFSNYSYFRDRKWRQKMLAACPKLKTDGSNAFQTPQVSHLPLILCNYKGLNSVYATMKANTCRKSIVSWRTASKPQKGVHREVIDVMGEMELQLCVSTPKKVKILCVREWTFLSCTMNQEVQDLGELGELRSSNTIIGSWAKRTRWKLGTKQVFFSSYNHTQKSCGS